MKKELRHLTKDEIDKRNLCDHQSDSNVEYTEEVLFQDGQGYENHTAIGIRCKKCKSTDFKVGLSNCLTFIQCPNCKWEEIIHCG